MLAGVDEGHLDNPASKGHFALEHFALPTAAPCLLAVNALK